jgi:integrase
VNVPKLTKRVVDNLEPGPKDRIVFDDELKGFGLRIAPTGRKTFLVQYRAGGRCRRVKIGQMGSVTPDQARKLARSVLGSVASGENPAEVIALDRKAPRVRDLAARYLRDHVELRLKPRTQREYRHCLDVYILPAIGSFRVADVSRADIVDIHSSMRATPYQANRVLEVARAMFNHAEIWGLRAEGANPCRRVKRNPERKRERHLLPEELSRLGAVLDERLAAGLETPFVIAAFKLLIFTGCRLNEIQTLKWEFLKNGSIELPDSKTGERRIPLPPAAQAVIARLPRDPENPFIIAGDVAGQHVTDLQRPWRRIRKAAGLDDVRIHDLRHTYASNAVKQGLSLPMVGKLLGHTQMQTTMRYAHWEDAPVRSAATSVSNALSAALASANDATRRTAPSGAWQANEIGAPANDAA